MEVCDSGEGIYGGEYLLSTLGRRRCVWWDHYGEPNLGLAKLLVNVESHYYCYTVSRRDLIL